MTKLAAKFGKSSKLTAKVDGDKEKLFELDTDKAKAKQEGSTVTYSKVKADHDPQGRHPDRGGHRHAAPGARVRVREPQGEGGDGRRRGAGERRRRRPRPRFGDADEAQRRGDHPAAVSPATRQGDEYSFPVLGGKVAEDGGSGEIRLDGGIRLAEAAPPSS